MNNHIAREPRTPVSGVKTHAEVISTPTAKGSPARQQGDGPWTWSRKTEHSIFNKEYSMIKFNSNSHDSPGS